MASAGGSSQSRPPVWPTFWPHLSAQSKDAEWCVAQIADADIQRFTAEPPELAPEAVRAAIEDMLVTQAHAGLAITDAATGTLLGNVPVRRVAQPARRSSRRRTRTQCPHDHEPQACQTSPLITGPTAGWRSQAGGVARAAPPAVRYQLVGFDGV